MLYLIQMNDGLLTMNIREIAQQHNLDVFSNGVFVVIGEPQDISVLTEYNANREALVRLAPEAADIIAHQAETMKASFVDKNSEWPNTEASIHHSQLLSIAAGLLEHSK